MRGIRFRVTLLAAGVLSIMLFATTLVLLGVQRRLLTDNLDESLATHASALLDNGNGRDGNDRGPRRRRLDRPDHHLGRRHRLDERQLREHKPPCPHHSTATAGNCAR